MQGKVWSMSPEKYRHRAMLSWLFVSALLVLCGVLGVLQYRWIGEVSVAARERLRGSLQASLNRFSREFDSELSTATRALLPTNSATDAQSMDTGLVVRYEQWKRTGRHSQIFGRIAIAVPQAGTVVLRGLDLNTGMLETIDWPETWSAVRNRLNSRMGLEPGQRWSPPDPFSEREGLVFEVPVFGNSSLGSTGRPGRPASPGRPPGPFGRREIAWAIFEVNLPYVHDVVLPELVQRDLSDYQVEVVTRTNPPSVIYQSDPTATNQAPKRISSSADASVGIFDPQYDPRPAGPSGMRDRGPGRGPGPGVVPGSGRWEMFVRHRAGSLETVVARLRWRNLAVTAGVLLLMMASVGALIRYTRRAQKLAQLQMDFVAGVSHELRTPLTVIHTAGYNLQGKMAHNPSQVERYGALIQQESGRLTDLVEQVLRFAGSEAGRVIQEPEPLSIASVIQDTMDSSKAVIEGSHCIVEQTIEPGLPLILGDPMALKHALQNLLTNAAKYGSKGSNWIGIFASKATDKGRAMVEIRVADRGPGIPADEQEHIFDPFFRGQRAAEDQVHGTGLGLNLVKKIVEAHGGTIRVRSEPMKGAEFIVLIPEAAAGVSG
ncbi:MAG: HAMP domain-containing histidine kinase [Acidobacteriia bacterium]|nr:HAMP domain-containing histidine kinase [Terriglobia bacterium]